MKFIKNTLYIITNKILFALIRVVENNKSNTP
jgi:hypothetical protein